MPTPEAINRSSHPQHCFFIQYKKAIFWFVFQQSLQFDWLWYEYLIWQLEAVSLLFSVCHVKVTFVYFYHWKIKKMKLNYFSFPFSIEYDSETMIPLIRYFWKAAWNKCLLKFNFCVLYLLLTLFTIYILLTPNYICRNVLGTKNLSEILSERESIGETMHANLVRACYCVSKKLLPI